MLFDHFLRPLGTLRISVTDRCNLRCSYCMPERTYAWLPRRDLLSFEEIVRLVRIFRGLGVDRVRITGGEPLLRSQLPELVRQLSQLGLADLALTTNGLLLSRMAPELKEAGLRRVTVSLDSLDPDVYLGIAQKGRVENVLAGLEAARQCGFDDLKIDTVLLRGRNDGGMLDLLACARSYGAELRFIEYMDVAGATRWNPADLVSKQEILDKLEQAHGPVTALPRRDSAPAERFRLAHGQTFGIIASMTEPFCRDCDRARLTADGHLLTCLYAREGVDLRQVLRGGASDERLTAFIASAWKARQDRGAEVRASLPERGSLVAVDELRKNPRLEMHTRGG